MAVQAKRVAGAAMVAFPCVNRLHLRLYGAVLLAIIGAAALAVAAIYFVLPTHSLPSFFPGHAHVKGYHRTRGAIAGLAGVVLLGAAVLLGWTSRWRAPVNRRRAQTYRLPLYMSVNDILSTEPTYRLARPVSTRGMFGFTARPVAPSSPLRRLLMSFGVLVLIAGLAGALAVVWQVPSPHKTSATPSTKVLVPSQGSSIKGLVALGAGVANTDKVRKVQFYASAPKRDDMLISGAGQTVFGYLGFWNTKAVPNGVYTIHSVAYQLSGNPLRSPGVTVTVAN
jgi:hypothetical protein